MMSMTLKGGFIMENKKGQLATGLVGGIVALIVTLIVSFVVITQLNGAGLLTAGSSEANTVTNLSTNLSAGVTNIATKIPTFFSIIAAVLIFGFLVYLWMQYKRMNVGQGGL